MSTKLGWKVWLLVILGSLAIIFGLLWSIQQAFLLPIGFFNAQNRYLLDGLSLFLTVLWALIYLFLTPNFEKYLLPLFHFVFALGVLPVLFSVKADTTFGALDSFTMGSFALVVTGFFLAVPKAQDTLDRYRILLYTLSATLVFFMSGMSLGVYDLFTNDKKWGIFVASTSDSLFLLGMVDLVIILILCFIFVIDEQKKKLLKEQEEEEKD